MTTQPAVNKDILLATLNARYIHTAFGLRCLFANLGDLQSRAQILEFTINQQALEIAEQLLIAQPSIIGFGVYIWNVEQTNAVVSLLRTVSPQTVIILGGPEVSFPPDQPDIVELADYVITGPSEVSFKQLCEQMLAGKRPLNKIIAGISAPLDQLASPYAFYSDDDIKNRIVYVEASRGCPFKCEFCLSALDKTAKPFQLESFLQDMDTLLQRGARNFKFIDRTFNLKVSSSIKILEFFLQRMTDDLYLHFELIPDNLPEALKQVLKHFPAGSLQFEVGVQPFDPEIQQLISRKQNNEKTRQNLSWLRAETTAHIHTDLIFGLPGDSLDNFSHSFNELVALNAQEIQLGILKRLRGAPINRHIEQYKMCFSPQPPYGILKTRDIQFQDLLRMTRFARYWDLIGNSGNFNQSLPVIFGENPFYQFLKLSDAIYALSSSTWKISLKRLYQLVFTAATETLMIPKPEFEKHLIQDFQQSKLKGVAPFLGSSPVSEVTVLSANKRQLKHLEDY
jgi:radical SAM superfamily enzyme YgiQ (UPF0313 family)